MNQPVLLKSPEEAGLPLEQQVVRLQALLEASRAVHSTIELPRVLEQAARIAVLELELDGAYFTQPWVGYGQIPLKGNASAHGGAEGFSEAPRSGEAEAHGGAFGTDAGEPAHLRIPLLSRDGAQLSEMVLVPGEGQQLSLYERDFLEGLALQTALAVENAINHQHRLDYARLEQDLDAARAIQQSLLPQSLPSIAGYSLAARSSACYQVGGDYLDIVPAPAGSYLILVADVAGKGLASALMGASFRSAFRALARESLPLEELACRLAQQHWEEGAEARRRYVTAIFVRLDPATGALEFINAGHNPACLRTPHGEVRSIDASGPPLGIMPGCHYTAEHAMLPPGGRLLLYTDGLTEVFQGDEEFGPERLFDAFADEQADSAESALATLWKTLDDFSGGAPQQDDMSAVALYRSSSPRELVSKERA